MSVLLLYPLTICCASGDWKTQIDSGCCCTDGSCCAIFLLVLFLSLYEMPIRLLKDGKPAQAPHKVMSIETCVPFVILEMALVMWT